MSILDKKSSLQERKLSVFIYLIWGIPLFCTIFRGIAKVGEVDDFINPFIIITCLLASIRQITSQLLVRDYVVYVIGVLLYFLTYWIFPQNEFYLNRYAFSFLLMCLPYLFYGKLISIEKYVDDFYKISVCVIVFFLWYLFRYIQRKSGSMEEQGIQEYMYFSYQALPHVLFVIWRFLSKPNVGRGLISCMGIFLLSSLGTRGALVCVLFFVLFYLLIGKKYSTTRAKYSTWLVASISVFAISSFLNELLLTLQLLLGDLGMSTRIFDMLLDSDFLGGDSVDERDDLINMTKATLKDNPILGVGIAGSFVWIKSYPHNILYDCWLTFGYVAGSMLFLYLVYLVISAYKAVRTSDEKGFLLVLVSCGFVSYFLSRTYLAAPDIFMLLGYCVYLKRKNLKNG